VYRTYLTNSGPTAPDRKLIDDTIARARAEWFAADEGIFDFLRDALTMDLLKPSRPPHSAPRVRRFALKVQQFTGPMMAKSLEDTAFYQFHRLLALNEVGGDPASTGLAVPAFHEAMQARAKEWPLGMTATATHDTKRGEDARARIAVLSEIPGEWTSAVSRWKVLNAPHLTLQGNFRAPSATFEYMLYQALLGAWPLVETIDGGFVERIQAYALKAAREGKEETSWLNPHEAYEKGVKSFIDKILDPVQSGEFLEALQTLARRVALLGMLSSLSQLTLKATLPGVPDFYQGTEFWDLSLVDPDNRRPVDFGAGFAGPPELDRLDDALAGWPDQAGLDPASSQAAQRARRRLRSRRLPAAGGARHTCRPCHCLRPSPRPRCGDRRGRASLRAVHAGWPGMARAGGLRRHHRPDRLHHARPCRRRFAARAGLP
jgi:(1->4)-alpha-D-glucan 1-alpha-D-glucosylmutase